MILIIKGFIFKALVLQEFWAWFRGKVSANAECIMINCKFILKVYHKHHNENRGAK